MSKKGRRHHTPPFVMLNLSMLATPAWLDLSGCAVKLLVHLISLHNGSNNGSIGLSERSAADAIGVARMTIRSAFADLRSHGFIAMTAEAAFSCKVKLAPTWRLTFHPCGSSGPTHDYRDWKP